MTDTIVDVVAQTREHVRALSRADVEDPDTHRELARMARSVGNATTAIERVFRQMAKVPALLEDPARRAEAVVKGWLTLPPEWRHWARAEMARAEELEGEEDAVELGEFVPCG